MDKSMQNSRGNERGFLIMFTISREGSGLLTGGDTVTDIKN